MLLSCCYIENGNTFFVAKKRIVTIINTNNNF
ncbi:Uncharacterised protein [Klebsiella pneumoniae]|nr:Uncharacterised protein [Klebsiella pneumoniae]VGG29202.1 Uncharacterised protein [Klebsiella pneumoniae]